MKNNRWKLTFRRYLYMKMIIKGKHLEKNIYFASN
jgi:hypothetical protein